jgi:hypothetical protein
MPIPKRRKGEKIGAWRSRIIGFLIKEGKTKKAAAGIAYGVTGAGTKRKKKK